MSLCPCGSLAQIVRADVGKLAYKRGIGIRLVSVG